MACAATWFIILYRYVYCELCIEKVNHNCICEICLFAMVHHLYTTEICEHFNFIEIFCKYQMTLCHVSITVKVNHYITTYGDKHVTRNDVYIDMILAYILHMLVYLLTTVDQHIVCAFECTYTCILWCVGEFKVNIDDLM